HGDAHHVVAAGGKHPVIVVELRNAGQLLGGSPRGVLAVAIDGDDLGAVYRLERADVHLAPGPEAGERYAGGAVCHGRTSRNNGENGRDGMMRQTLMRRALAHRWSGS